MCGRVFTKVTVEELLSAFSFARGGAEAVLGNLKPRYNGAPGQEFPIIVQEPDMPGAKFMRAWWGLIPSWMKQKPKPAPINARAETIATNGMFKSAYRARRALMPIDEFFEWKATKGEKIKQPYAIAMKDGSPFAVAAIWEKWRNRETGDEVKTFAVVTCPANELMATIHDRMPVIIAEADWSRWLSDEPDPRDLLKPYPADLMTMWPISTRVNSYKNDEPSLLDPL